MKKNKDLILNIISAVLDVIILICLIIMVSAYQASQVNDRKIVEKSTTDGYITTTVINGKESSVSVPQKYYFTIKDDNGNTETIEVAQSDYLKYGIGDVICE